MVVKSTIENEMTLQEASQYYRISIRTLHRWIANGNLPAYRYGSRLIRIRPSDMEKLRARVPARGAA